MALELNDEGEPTNPKVRLLADILYGAISPNFEVTFEEGYYEAANALLESDWFRLELADAFDSGVARAGRYGHEDYWESGSSPYLENPWRSKSELRLSGWDVD